MSNTSDPQVAIFLKPRSKMWSGPCGCNVERCADETILIRQCVEHFRAYAAVSGELLRMRKMTQRQILRSAGLEKSN